MTEAFKGEWRVRVTGTSAEFAQRFSISGADSGNGIYPGTVGTAVTVNGDHWTIQLEWNNNKGSGWRESVVQREQSSQDPTAVVLKADDNFPDKRDNDFNDLIVVCENLAVVLPACAPPSARIPPQFQIPFRRPIVLKSLSLMPGDPGAQLSIACVPAKLPVEPGAGEVVRIGLDPRFQQTWTLRQLAIGDLASSISLAPGERLTLEVSSSQRQVVTRDVLDSAESLRAIENTVIDREAVNVVRSNTKTTNWHVDGTGGIAGAGPKSLDLKVGFSQEVRNSNQTTIDRLTETTRKSSETLKTLHKIEVKGTTETLVQNRMVRVVRNPYRDRTLSLNVFQLIKKYTIISNLIETRAAIIVPVTNLLFDDAFIVANVDFLQRSLLDSVLLDQLPQALKAAEPGKPTQSGSFGTAVLIANVALRFLFDQDNIFKLPNLNGKDPNIVKSSFDAGIGNSGLQDATNNDGDHAGRVFAIMNFFFHLRTDAELFPPQDSLKDEMAIRFATALANQIDADWKEVKALANLFDNEQFTEILRRVPGFLAMVKGMLQPLVEPVAAEKAALRELQDQQQLLRRLLGHLECNRNYYIERFLRYVWEKTDGQAIVDFATAVLARIAFPASPLVAADAYDLDATFIDKQQIVVPGTRALEPADIVAVARALDPEVPSSEPPVDSPKANTIDVEIPADGIHLEVAQGACVLKDVPSQPFTEADIEQSFKVTQG